MLTSQNGWPVVAENGSGLLHIWSIPTKHGEVRIKLRRGSAGFLLCHLLLWFADVVEPVKGDLLDDWGWAVRPIRGKTTGYSNHAAGTAIDLNATRHVLGRRNTFTRRQQALIRARLALYRGVLGWGGNYRTRADEMHFEVVKPLAAAERVARRLADSHRGRRILAANPGQRKVIFS